MFSLIISIALIPFLTLSVIFYIGKEKKQMQKSHSVKQMEHSQLETPEIETTSIPKKNIETSTIVEKAEINNYDFSKLSDSLNYIVLCFVVFFFIKYSFKLLKSMFRKINIIREERKTLKLIREFNNKITNDSMIVSYADAIEGQSMMNSILLERGSSLKLEVLNHELNNKKEIIKQIINNKYILD